MITRTWRVYGIPGHRQRVSFGKSFTWDFSNEYGRKGTRIIEMLNSDKTNTNEYTIVRITADTSEDCQKEFNGQITDGIFENSRVGKIEELDEKGAVMEKYQVSFWGGESRTNPGQGVNYMIVAVPDEDGEDVELYAECPEPEEWEGRSEDEIGQREIKRFADESFVSLKNEIIRQAKGIGFNIDQLEF